LIEAPSNLFHKNIFEPRFNLFTLIARQSSSLQSKILCLSDRSFATPTVKTLDGDSPAGISIAPGLRYWTGNPDTFAPCYLNAYVANAQSLAHASAIRARRGGAEGAYHGNSWT
jgi:hypothetical protein